MLFWRCVRPAAAAAFMPAADMALITAVAARRPIGLNGGSDEEPAFENVVPFAGQMPPFLLHVCNVHAARIAAQSGRPDRRSREPAAA